MVADELTLYSMLASTNTVDTYVLCIYSMILDSVSGLRRDRSETYVRRADVEPQMKETTVFFR